MPTQAAQKIDTLVVDRTEGGFYVRWAVWNDDPALTAVAREAVRTSKLWDHRNQDGYVFTDRSKAARALGIAEAAVAEYQEGR